MSTGIVLRPGEPGETALWLRDARGRLQPSDADEIGLSDALAERIEEWIDALDAVFDEDAPDTRRFASDTERRAFLAEGHAIAEAILGELGADIALEVDLGALEGGAP